MVEYRKTMINLSEYDRWSDMLSRKNKNNPLPKQNTHRGAHVNKTDQDMVHSIKQLKLYLTIMIPVLVIMVIVGIVGGIMS